MRTREIGPPAEAKATDSRKAPDRVSNEETQAPLGTYSPRSASQPGGDPIPQIHSARLNHLPHSQSVRAANHLLQLQRRYGNRYVQRVLNFGREGDADEVATSGVEGAINRSCGSGQSLDHVARARLESAFEADFNGVRVRNRAATPRLVQRGPGNGGEKGTGTAAAVPYPGKLETRRVLDPGGRHIRIGEWVKESVKNPKTGEMVPTETEMFWVDFEVDAKGVMTASARTVDEAGRYRSPALKLKPEFAKAEQAFKKGGIQVDAFEGDWSYMSATEMSTNLRVYQEQVRKGATREEAALETPSGKAAAAAGFTEVRIKSEGMEKLDHIPDGEKYLRVRVTFTRPTSGPGGKKPGEGPASKPATPPATTTKPGTRVKGGVMLAILGANVVLNWVIESGNEERIRKEIKAKEPELLKQQKEDPTLGFLLLFRYSGGADSGEGPTASARFEGLGWQRGYNENEAKASWKAAARIDKPGTTYQFGWVDPLVAPLPEVLATPFEKVGLAKFADIRKIEFQRVEFKEWGGFDTNGTDGPVDATKWDDAEGFRFIVLRMPPQVTYRNVGGRLDKKKVTIKDESVIGGQVPALMLDGKVPAITVWPADAKTAELFDATHEVGDKEGKLEPLANVDLVRWLKPSQVKLLTKF